MKIPVTHPKVMRAKRNKAKCKQQRCARKGKKK